MPGQDLGLPAPDRAGQAGQLSNLDAFRPAVEAPQRGPGVSQVTGGIDRTQQLLALPRDRHLAGRIPDGQPSPQPYSSLASELLGGGQQQLADAVQRIWLAAPVAEGGLLGPPADLIDHRVGQLDGVEVVHDHGRMPKRCHQGAGVATPGVEGDRADLGQPGSGPSTKPAVHRGPGPVGHHIQQPTTLQIHQASDVPGRCSAGGLEEAGLIQPKRSDILQPRGVIHQRGAVLVHRPHDGRPADPQVAGDRSHRVGVLADPPARLGPGPLGQHRPRPDRDRLLGPGPHSAGWLNTAPDPLAPGQHHRAATDRQVPHPHRAASMESGLAAAGRTPHRDGGGLDRKPPLVVDALSGGDLEPVQAKQDRP
jgi:hypothetical protein